MLIKVSVLGCIGALMVGFACQNAAAATLPERQSGMWQSTTYVTLADGSKANKGAPVITVSCVDPSTDVKFFTVNGSQCSSLAINGGGTQYTIDGTCTNRGKTVTVHTALTYTDPNTVELAGTVTTDNGPITLQSELSFTGPCLAGMAPGDEGSMVQGAFSKTDNINDSDNQ